MLSYEEYIDQYRIIHQEGPYGNARRLADFLRPYLEASGASTVLDYGCGRGGLFERLRVPKPYSYDPAVPEYSDRCKLPARVDLVLCLDVLEHIPEAYLPIVLSDIVSFSDNAIFVVSTFLAAKLLPNGENAHCTLRTEEWWYELLLRYYGRVQVGDLTGRVLLFGQVEI